MRFQTHQVIEISGISHDTLRVWKRKLKPLSEVDGRSTQYTLAQVIGICLLEIAVKQLGLAISRFEEFADDIFEKLEACVDHEGLDGVLYVTPDEITIVASAPKDAENYAAIALEPVVAKIHAAILGDSKASAEQLILPLDSG